MAKPESVSRSLEAVAPPIPEPVSDQETGAFFRRVDKWAFWIAFLATFAVYFHTNAPTVTLEDSGELCTGSDYLGVPHPPGYPIWTLFTWFFNWIFHWVKYFGTPDSNELIVWKSIKLLFGQYKGDWHPNPAWSVGLCSNFFGALACGMQAMLVSRSGLDMLRGLKKATEVLGEKQESLICLTGGVVSGLLLAFSPVLWSQSTIVEVYALNAAFQIACLVLLYRWMSRPKEMGTMILMWYVFGLGLTNHQTLLFLGPALAVGLLVRDLELFATYAVAGLGIIAVVIMNVLAGAAHADSWKWVAGPFPVSQHIGFWVETFTLLAVPAIAWRAGLKRGREVTFALWAAMAGLSFNFFMSFASEQNPPINWGYPRTWEGFMHAITRGQYEAINVADIFGSHFLQQVEAYLRDLRGQFTMPIAVLGALPFCTWSFNWGGRRIKAIYVAVALAALTVVLGVIDSVAEIKGVNLGKIGELYRLLGMMIFPLAFFGLMITAVNYFRRLWEEKEESGFWTMLIAWAIIGLTGLGLLYADLQWMLHLGKESMEWKYRLIILFFIFGPPAAVAAIFSLSKSAVELRCEIESNLQRVLLMTVAAFLSLSVIFITFQNLEMDIQTLFIGRVQFIQSHAIYSLWLGFGVIFLLTHLDVILGGRKFVTYAFTLASLGMPGVLIYQNYCDPEQIRIDGGAQMNKHDFGWQFGAWEMGGAPEILKDIPEEQVKLFPNPNYPPPMEQNAIFFGGTDPGRFVPTWMIYCGHFRSDVYLITQNALADNTYMNVMRDLYGDLIYIPSQQDSNLAFQQYVQDVQSGKVQAGADVSFEGGRVQVQGVGGVMMINGILCDMIFKHNKRTNAFYVEESYVIPWMYPYLEPHGLIMKLNTEQVPQLSPETVKNDRAFWDWYTQYLIGTKTNMPDTIKTATDVRKALKLSDQIEVEPLDVAETAGQNVEATNAPAKTAAGKMITWRIGGRPEFFTDVVARKTFSKLRSAIAGIYIARHMFSEAEYAFKQSIELYPLSPEANFRLADAYMQQLRFTDARKIIENFLSQDTENTKVSSFLDQIKNLEKANARRDVLEVTLSKGGDLNLALELLGIYRSMNMAPRMDGLADSIVGQQGLPPQVILQIAQMYGEMKRADRVAAMLQKYLLRSPTDSARRVDLAKCLIAMQQPGPALGELRIAIQQGGEPVREIIRRDASAFSPLAGNAEFQRLVPPAQGGNPLNAPGGLPLF